MMRPCVIFGVSHRGHMVSLCPSTGGGDFGHWIRTVPARFPHCEVWLVCNWYVCRAEITCTSVSCQPSAPRFSVRRSVFSFESWLWWSPPELVLLGLSASPLHRITPLQGPVAVLEDHPCSSGCEVQRSLLPPPPPAGPFQGISYSWPLLPS